MLVCPTDFQFILFDTIGTVVQEPPGADSFIINCFQSAFDKNGLTVKPDDVAPVRGMEKRRAIIEILGKNRWSLSLSEPIYGDFMEGLNGSLPRFCETPGAGRVFGFLKQKGVKIGLGSGLPMFFLENLIRQAGWQIANFDYIGSAETLGKSRPDPAMIFAAMQQLNVHDKSKILKIGDTVADILEGKNAGVNTAVVLSGTQKKAELAACRPDYILENITDLLPKNGKYGTHP